MSGKEGMPSMRQEEVLCALAKQNTIPILREMNKNGWYSLEHLADRLSMDTRILERDLTALQRIKLVERRFNNCGANRWEYKLIRDLPEIDLQALLEKESHAHDALRFYNRLVFGILVKAAEFDRSLHRRLLEATQSTRCENPRGLQLLSTLDAEGGYDSTMMRLSGLLGSGLFDGIDEQKTMSAVKNAYLAVVHSLIEVLNDHVEQGVAKLILRTSSRDVLIDGGWLVERFDLLQGVPTTYFKQVG